MDTLLNIFTTCLLISGFDYAGYNLTKHDDAVLTAYRVTQVSAIAAGAYRLKVKYDYGTAGKAVLLQWSFTNDLLYYGWAWVINPSNKSRFEGRDAVRANLFHNNPIPHAKWTLMAPWGDNWRTPLGVVGQSLGAITFSICF